jgi:tRNA(Ile)-lysidine synthase
MSLIDFFSLKIEEIFAAKNFATKTTAINTIPVKFAVAVSGGCDSLALTLLLEKFCQADHQSGKIFLSWTKKIELLAVTVDHKMRQGSSAEALKLKKILEKKKISHQILRIDKKKLPGSNIEANLRNLRYELLYEFCLKNKVEFLFLGHQLEDVAENFLIRLFRGSGLDGLSAIAEISQFKKIKLIRPLLNFEKNELKNFLQSQNIVWLEDKSNENEKFLRNKIRNFLASFPEKNVIQKRIAKAAAEITEIRDFFDKILLSEAKKILHFRPQGFFLLDQKKLQVTEEKIALKILALVLIEVSGKIYKPRLEKLKSFYRHLVTNDSIKPRNFYGCIASQYDSRYLIIDREKTAINLQNIEKFDEKYFLVDGRFLNVNPKDNTKSSKFYFRTILKDLHQLSF